jgi:hypothetical protein
MPDPYEPQGLLPNVLRYIDRPGQAVRNVLAGRPGAASRQLLDMLGETLDAPLPGDWIPSATSPDDYVSGSELLGIDTPVASTAADIGIGVATDPLTYLSFGAVPLAKQAAMGGKYAMELGIPFTGGAMRKTLAVADEAMDPLSVALRGADKGITAAAKGLDRMGSSSVVGAQKQDLAKGYEGLKAWIRRAAGAEKIDPGVAAKMQEAAAEGSVASKLYTGRVKDLMDKLPEDERILLTLANIGVDIGSLKPSADLSQAVVLQGPDFASRVAELATRYNKDPAKLQGIAAGMLDISKSQWDEAVAKGAVTGAGNPEYLARSWLLDKDSNALKGRSLKTPEEILGFLQKPDIGLELDSARLMSNRAMQQGRMLEQASLAKSMGATGEGLESLRKSAKEAIESTPFAEKDTALALQRALDGMPPRSGIFNALRTVMNPRVKGAMVYGVVLPKFGSLLRNKIGMGFQAAAEPGVREEAFKHLNPVHILREMGKAWDEAYGTAMFGKMDDLSVDMRAIEDAFKGAKQTDDVAKTLRDAGRDDLADAVKHGVLDGFVSTEELITKINRDPKFAKFWDIFEAPGRMFQAMEQRGRLMTFKNLRDKMGPAEAATKTKKAMYDYGISSPENRALRDVLPFGQFMVKSIPQQAKLLSERPALAAAAAPLFYDPSGDQPPVYPYMEGRSRVSLGPDEQGNEMMLTGFGLPMESLDLIPNLSGSPMQAGRDLSRGALSSTNPVIKTGAAWMTGRDPYFGTQFGSYDKIPLVGEAGDIGRVYNVATGTGLLEPLGAGLARQAGALADDRKPLGARVADFLTGAKLTSVDPDIAAQRAITEHLEARPDVAQYRTFYQKEPDAEFTELMQALRESKARSKEKREAAALASPQ